MHCGDLFAPVGSQRFDHVVANVPFVPVLDGHPFPLAGAGGADGFAVGRRVLDGLWQHLAPGGSAHLAALLLRGRDGLLLAPELDAWARAQRCGVHVTLTGSLPLGPEAGLVRATAEAIAASSRRQGATGPRRGARQERGGDHGREPARASHSDLVAEHYRRLGAESASWAFLRVDGSGCGLRVLNLGANRPGPWLSMT